MDGEQRVREREAPKGGRLKILYLGNFYPNRRIKRESCEWSGSVPPASSRFRAMILRISFSYYTAVFVPSTHHLMRGDTHAARAFAAPPLHDRI